MPAASSEGPIAPVFVGGTGRSGTTIAGRLIDQFPGIRVTRPREVRFISGTGGVLDALQTSTQGRTADGREVTPDQVRKRLHGPWFKRPKPSGFVGGLHLSISKPDMRAATERYQDEWANDPYASSRHLVEAIVNGQLSEGMPRRWVDTTPKNAQRSDELLQLFPDARVLHMTRDGRDVAMSFAEQHFGPPDAMSALEAWNERMTRALEAESRAPAGTVRRLPLMALAKEDREASLATIAALLDLELAQEVRDWFNTEVDAERTHEGRWRRDADPELARALDERYASFLEGLSARWPDPLG